VTELSFFVKIDLLFAEKTFFLNRFGTVKYYIEKSKNVKLYFKCLPVFDLSEQLCCNHYLLQKLQAVCVCV